MNRGVQMKQQLWIAAAVIAMALATSTVTLAQDGNGDGDDRGRWGQGNDQGNDNRWYQQASDQRNRGYSEGYRMGFNHGSEERREGDRNGWRDSNCNRGGWGWRDGDDNAFSQAYRNGCRSGFEDGFRGRDFRLAQYGGGYGDGNFDENGQPWGRDRGNDPFYGRGGYTIALHFGGEDGRTAAYEDWQRRKSYNSRPRGRFDDADRGYQRQYGDRDQYKREYTQGYRQGYDQEYRRTH